jgi:hypothetical protein
MPSCIAHAECGSHFLSDIVCRNIRWRISMRASYELHDASNQSMKPTALFIHCFTCPMPLAETESLRTRFLLDRALEREEPELP